MDHLDARHHHVTGVRPGGPAHAARPAPVRAAVAAGILGLTIAAAVGVTALVRTAGSGTSTPTSARLMTVAPSIPPDPDDPADTTVIRP